MSWRPGDVVVWREAWRGRGCIRIPVRVVRDDARAFACDPCEGTKYRADGERVLARWAFPTGLEDRVPDPFSSVPELPDRRDA